MKIFIIESPNPNDLLESRNEKSSLESMCRMFGHQSTSFTTFSKDDLFEKIKYISEVDLIDGDILCLHFSCHGNNDGLKFGADFLSWFDFSQAIAPMFKNRQLFEKTFIIISACGANGQIITDKINGFKEELKRRLTPPSYFFVYNQEVIEWSDALLCWAILYHQLSRITNYSKIVVQEILNRIKISDLGDIMYFRWDQTKLKYLRFKPE